MKWRWDQGRLEYFKFANVVVIARELSKLEGIPLDTQEDLLRKPLKQGTGLPFSPAHYKVWRNYARVFHCSMLATKVGGRLVVTDLCRMLAADPCALSSDQYFNFVFSRFCFPFPAFDSYDSTQPPVFPFVAIIKYLMANSGAGIALPTVFSRIVGNHCTGLEPVDAYTSLPETTRKPLGDEERQVREMLVFLGQASYMKWFNRRLYIDTTDYDAVLHAIHPAIRAYRKHIPQEEFLSLTSVSDIADTSKFDIVLKDREPPEFSIREGEKVLVSHRRTERSPLLRRKYFEVCPNILCDACSLKPRERYPWTDNILELHHILPLSATLNVNGTTTRLDDLVPLCPCCHKSIHIFYRIKLDEWGVDDFGSFTMARDVYKMAKREICS